MRMGQRQLLHPETKIELQENKWQANIPCLPDLFYFESI